MSLNLSIKNFGDNNIAETALVKTDAASGQPSVILDNAQNFSANDYVLLGKRGGGVSKIYKIASVSVETLTLTSNLEFYLNRGAPVTKLFGNKIKLYTAPYVAGQTPADNAYSALSGGLIAIDPDQSYTLFTDPTGSDQLWYKYTYYNDVSLAETALADSSAMRDDRATQYTSIAAVRHEAGFDGNNDVSDETIDRKRRAAEAKINGMLAGRYVLPFAQPINAQIADLTTRLAAGYTMIAEYGTFDGQDKTKGEKLRDDAIAELKEIQSGSIVVTDLQAVDTTITSSGGFSSGFTSDNPLGFSRQDIIGYSGRPY